MNTISLKLIEHLPSELEADILYVSEEFEIAAHLCPCGCGSKVVTPLGVNEWSFSEFDGKPTLNPSIGSWQLPCQSHYWIDGGKILWSSQWSAEEIEAGRMAEEEKRIKYYEELEEIWQKETSLWSRIRKCFLSFFHYKP